MTVGVVILALVALSGWWLGAVGTVALPFLRHRAINLEGVPVATDTQPAVWLVAHLDSKSQTVPMLLRIAGVALCTIAWLALLALWGAKGVMAVPQWLFIAAALGSAVGAFPLIGTLVGAEGDGALDNASGVAAVMATLDLLHPAPSVGVLITSAEELGLAGARAWVRDQRGYRSDHTAYPPPVVINCDSVDDSGKLVCMLPVAVARRLSDPIRAAALDSHVAPAIQRLIPGVLVDAIAFTQAGYPALTVSRGGWRSLARIHTRRDDLRHMTGAGIDEAARFISELVRAVGDT